MAETRRSSSHCWGNRGVRQRSLAWVGRRREQQKDGKGSQVREAAATSPKA